MTLPKTPSFRLDGKYALVAGASSGIGLACSVALAEAGAHVTLAARRADKLEELATQLRDKGWAAEALQLDVTDTDATAAAIDDAAHFDIRLNAVVFLASDASAQMTGTHMMLDGGWTAD